MKQLRSKVIFASGLVIGAIYTPMGESLATTIPGLDQIINVDKQSPQEQSLQNVLQENTRNDNNTVNTIQDASGTTTHVPQTLPADKIIVPKPRPAALTTQTTQVPQNNTQVQSHTPQVIPIDKIILPKPRPAGLKSQDLQQVLEQNINETAQNDVLSIIADSQINKILEDVKYSEKSQHKLVWLEATSVPPAPARPKTFSSQAGSSQTTYAQVPSLALEGLVLSNQGNMAMRGKNIDKIKILTPPPRPRNLLANAKNLQPPTEGNIPDVASSIEIDRSTGGLKIRYTNIRFQKSGKCSIRNARNVTGLGNVSVVPAAVMSKDLSIKMAQFEKNVLQPAARKYYGAPATQMKHLSSFRCSFIAGTKTPSQHGLANALDVSSFVFADGRSVDLIKGWKGSRRERKFLRELQNGACQIFGTTLTPNYNKAHYNHFHFDGKKRRSQNICK